MYLTNLSLTSFRNIAAKNLQIHPVFNLFIGKNGVGKTSILESIFLLLRKKSFRTNNLDRCIKEGETSFVCRAGFSESSYLGLEKKVGQNPVYKLNKENISNVDLANFLPVQILNSSIYNYVDGGPSFKRKLLDWGLFYSNSSFVSNWALYQKALKQRNHALKYATNQVENWDLQLAKYGSRLDEQRKEYVTLLNDAYKKFASNDFAECEFVYKSGWNKNLSLVEALQANKSTDLILKSTSVGPHRADLSILFKEQDVKDYLSRGQQKKFLVYLLLSQSVLLKETLQLNTLFLLDDIQAEMDEANIKLLLEKIKEHDFQVLYTAISPYECVTEFAKTGMLFHVEQ